MRMKSLSFWAALLPFTVAPALAASVSTCDSYIANAAFLAFPTAENTAEFADGRVRLITLDTAGEPACCSFHLMVLYPSEDGSNSECGLISGSADLGYFSIFVGNATVLRNDAEGMSLIVPTESNVDGTAVAAEMQLDIDFSAGTLSAK